MPCLESANIDLKQQTTYRSKASKQPLCSGLEPICYFDAKLAPNGCLFECIAVGAVVLIYSKHFLGQLLWILGDWHKDQSLGDG
jgi:hypothetical protein